eukprot:3712938-Amphidinium_carterae.1
MPVTNDSLRRWRSLMRGRKFWSWWSVMKPVSPLMTVTVLCRIPAIIQSWAAESAMGIVKTPAARTDPHTHKSQKTQKVKKQ